jgi:predicted metallo-beta-lactamase superfamily hydrolase
MCTNIETPSVRILIDPGVSLSPNRFRLPPHPLEFESIRKARQRLEESAKKADVVVISHYHFDHYTPSSEDWLVNWTNAEIARTVYEGKLVLAKSFRAHVNSSQRRRGWLFKKTGGRYARKLDFADKRTYRFGDTTLRFSSPVPHGRANTPLGWLIMLTVEHSDERVMFASDVQGPLDDEVLHSILAEKPDLLIVGGPPSYLVGHKIDNTHLQHSLANFKVLVQAIPVVIVEHHLLRDAQWEGKVERALEAARLAGNEVFTAAAFLGIEDQLLEAKRRELFEKIPPSEEFRKWTRTPEQQRRKLKPPL